MSRFSEIPVYKNNIISKILEDDNLIKALTNITKDFIDQPLISDKNSIIYSNLYPYRYVPETTTDPKVYITMAFTNYRLYGTQFKSGNIYFYALCHKSLMQTDYGCNRCEYIVNKIDSLFQDERGYGLGKLEFNSMNDISVNDEYVGIELGYKLVDFK